LGYWSQLLKAKTQEAEPKGAVGGALSLETMMPARDKKDMNLKAVTIQGC
jgi:hypothetical protein